MTKEQGQIVSVWRYIGATVVPLALLFISVLLLVLYLNTEIRLTEKEFQGIKTIRLAHDGIIQLQKIRGLSEISTQGSDPDDLDIPSLQKQFITFISSPKWQSYGALFEITNKIGEVKKTALKLFSNPADINYAEGNRFQEYSQLINDMYRTIRLVADRSHLIQEQDIDTYYMVNLAVKQLPEIIEYIGKVRGIGSGIIAKRTIDDSDKILFGKHLAACDLAFKRMEEDINLILMTVPELKAMISPLTDKTETGLAHFTEESQEILASRLSQFDAEHYFHDGTLVISAYHALHAKITNLLSIRLKDRLQSQYDLRFYTIALALLGAILIIYFINSFYRTNRAAFRTIERLSISDHLTDLYNRRYLHQVFPQELRRNRREMKSLSLGILDVDHFKAYNDIYGHPEGDIVLRRVADTLKETLRRASDFVFRIGGEEFCFILSDIKEDDVKLLLEQIRLRIMAMEIKHEGNDDTPFVTVSIGAVYLDRVTDVSMDEIIRCADFALYIAKDMGRNCWHFENLLSATDDAPPEWQSTIAQEDWQI